MKKLIFIKTLTWWSLTVMCGWGKTGIFAWGRSHCSYSADSFCRLKHVHTNTVNKKPAIIWGTLLKMRLSSHGRESVLIYFLTLWLYFAFTEVRQDNLTHTFGLVLYMLSSRPQRACSWTIARTHRRRCRKLRRDHFSGCKSHVCGFSKLRLTCNPTQFIWNFRNWDFIKVHFGRWKYISSSSSNYFPMEE